MSVLGIFAVVSGYVNTPWFGTFLGDWLTEGSHALGHGHIEGPAWIMFVATGVSLAGIVLAWFMYGSKLLSRDWLVKPFPMWYKVLFNKYYVDEIYHVLAVLGSRTIAYFLQVFDTYIVGGLVKGTALLAQGIGRAGARLQDGQIQTYGTVAFFGIAVLVVIIALTGGYFG